MRKEGCDIHVAGLCTSKEAVGAAGFELVDETFWTPPRRRVGTGALTEWILVGAKEGVKRVKQIGRRSGLVSPKSRPGRVAACPSRQSRPCPGQVSTQRMLLLNIPRPDVEAVRTRSFLGLGLLERHVNPQHELGGADAGLGQLRALVGLDLGQAVGDQG